MEEIWSWEILFSYHTTMNHNPEEFKPTTNVISVIPQLNNRIKLQETFTYTIHMFVFKWYVLLVNYVRWVCLHGMVHPQFADGWKASGHGMYLRIYWINSSGQPTRNGPPAWGLGVGLTALTVNNFTVSKCFKRLGTGLILWHDLRNGKRHEVCVLGM